MPYPDELVAALTKQYNWSSPVGEILAERLKIAGVEQLINKRLLTAHDLIKRSELGFSFRFLNKREIAMLVSLCNKKEISTHSTAKKANLLIPSLDELTNILENKKESSSTKRNRIDQVLKKSRPNTYLFPFFKKPSTAEKSSQAASISKHL